jgi:hypothetical protein
VPSMVGKIGGVPGVGGQYKRVRERSGLCVFVRVRQLVLAEAEVLVATLGNQHGCVIDAFPDRT